MDSTLVVPTSKRQRIDSVPSLSSPEDEAPGNVGLVECEKMDAALALVASAGIDDVNAYLLDDILFHIDFCNLLDVRRVCKNWHTALSRESASFLRHVVIDLASPYLKRLDATNSGVNLWQLAPKAKTVFFYGGTFGKSEMGKLLEPYTDLVVATSRFLPIKRITFARTTVLSTAFRSLMFQRASVQIVVYKTTVNFAVADVFRFRTEEADSYADEFNKSIIPIGFNRAFFVMTPDMIPAMDMKKKQQRYHSVAAIHFAMKSFPFTQPRLNWLYREMRRFPAAKLDRLVEGLLRRFGPTDVDVAGMHFLLHQNEQGFVAAVHPMVNVLLNHYLKLVKDLKQANQVPAVQPEQPQPPQA